MKRKSALVIALVLVLTIAALFFLAPGPAPTRQKIRLPDGNIVTLEKVTFSVGSQHDFSFDESGLGRYRQKLPRFLRHYFPSRGRMSWNTTSNSLVLWFTMADGKTGAPLDFNILDTEVVDEHGCSTRTESYGSMSTGPNATVYLATYSQFARRQPTLRVRLRERPRPGAPLTAGEPNRVVAEFDVPNPVRGPFPVWTPEPLPAARTNADLVFLLKETGDLALGPAWSGPRIDILRGGLLVEDWERGEIHVTDATGNRGHRPFCTKEPVLKLEVEFLRNAKADFLPAEIFRLTNLTVPDAGEAILFTNTFALRGHQFEIIALAGPGHFAYSNTVITIAEPSPTGQGESSDTSTTSQGGTAIHTLDVHRKRPHVALVVPSLAADERLLVRARFQDGVAQGLVVGSYSDRLWLFSLSGVTNAGPFDLDVIVQRTWRAEFFVKPPGK